MSQLTKAQKEYFKDSVIRNDDGSLKIVYHGTPKGGFVEFRGRTFFTDDKKLAEYFTQPQHHGKIKAEPCLFECYINCKNPLIIDAQKQQYNHIPAPDYIINDIVEENRNLLCDELYLSSWEEFEFDYNELSEKDLLILYDRCFEEYYNENGITIEKLQYYAEDNGYDGLIVNNVRDLNDNIPRTQYITFEPNQIKSVDNLYPTKNDNFINNEEDYFKNSSLEDKLAAAEERAALQNKEIENKSKEDLFL